MAVFYFSNDKKDGINFYYYLVTLKITKLDIVFN